MDDKPRACTRSRIAMRLLSGRRAYSNVRTACHGKLYPTHEAFHRAEALSELSLLAYPTAFQILSDPFVGRRQ